MIKMREASQTLTIWPASKNARTAWQIAADDITRTRIDRRLVTAADGIEWAIQTSRLSGSVEMAFRKLTTYQTLQVLVSVANSVETMAEVPALLNQKYQA